MDSYNNTQERTPTLEEVHTMWVPRDCWNSAPKCPQEPFELDTTPETPSTVPSPDTPSSTSSSSTLSSSSTPEPSDPSFELSDSTAELLETEIDDTGVWEEFYGIINDTELEDNHVAWILRDALRWRRQKWVAHLITIAIFYVLFFMITAVGTFGIHCLVQAFFFWIKPNLQEAVGNAQYGNSPDDVCMFGVGRNCPIEAP